MNLYVKKANGSKQLFEKEKIIKTCLRMGANRDIANKIAEKIESEIYDGISTENILDRILFLLKEHSTVIKHLLDLRKGLSLMHSKSEFELFVRTLLSENGYEVTPNLILSGRCVEHEVDCIAIKDGVSCLVEAKHHSNYHKPTGLDESRIVRAVLEDVIEGFETRRTKWKIDSAMIVTNTRFSEHAIKYGKCRNILQIGWSFPPFHGLQDMIEEKKLHPITCLKSLRKKTREKLVSAGIITLKQLIDNEPEELAYRTKIPKSSLQNLIKNIKDCTKFQ